VLHHSGPVTDACFDRAGARALTASADGTAQLWDVGSGVPIGEPLIHPGGLRSARFSPDGARVLTLGADGRARIFALDASAPPLVVASEPGPIGCAAFDPGGTVLACGTSTNAIEIRDAWTGILQRTLSFESSKFGGSGVTALAFRPTADEIAVGCGDRTLRFWNPRTGEPTRPEATVFTTWDLVYGRGGDRLLATGRLGGGAARVFLLDAAKSSMLPEIMHTSSVGGGTLSADGELVLTFAKDGSVHVWEARSGRPVAHRESRGSAVLDAAFDGGASSPRAVVAREDGTVSVWPVDPVPAARVRMPRGIHPHEKERERHLALPLRFD
jgi:WD40 repeat protein